MNTAVIRKGGLAVERKTVSISAKRQITIPQKFYEAIGFTNEAECIVRGNELVIRPFNRNSGGEFAEQILAELIAAGLSGEALLSEFKKKQALIRPAVESMLEDAHAAARGDGEFYTYDDIFGTEG